jgi:Asp-tRNA(Asn)/Glu-tRNA(Gln) amidotransferase B subunit
VGCKDLKDRTYVGAKRAMICADCAYAMPDEVPVDGVGRLVDIIIADNPGKWEQALHRPQLIGWFVGQTFKRLNGVADPDEVFEKVMARFGAKP